MYEFKNGNLVATINTPYESAGCIYYYNAPDDTTKVILFERFNDKKNKAEFELGTFGKSDFGIINDENDSSKEQFVEKVKKSGQESPSETALREASEETNAEQYHLLLNKKDYKLFTSVQAADLKQVKDGTFDLVLGSANLLSEENLKEKWRTFNKILLTDPAFSSVIQQVFSGMLKAPTYPLTSNPATKWYTTPLTSYVVVEEKQVNRNNI